MRNKFKKTLVVIVGILGILFLGFALMRWLFNDHEFHHGDLNYYLLTDKEFRQFPVIGAKPAKVLYKSYIQDGTAPEMLKMAYDSSVSFAEALRIFKDKCNKLKYTFLPTESQKDFLVYTTKGEYEEICIRVKPINRVACSVTVTFVKRLN
ncbi:MAG TPA: hypothetical protein VEC37_08150 [Bacillota bacterium]|nr:hypothetical protein [Bacillota bacterium]